jgi:hypothetical protein
MNERVAPRIRILAVLVLLGFAWPVLSPFWALPARADGAVPPPPREFLDDPPGVPARPVPGALPSEPVRFGRSSAHQVNVSPGGANIPGDAANEPSIAVNPLAPNNMAIGWRQFDTRSSNFRQAGRAFSSDGGRTWTFPGVLTPGVFRSDPVLDVSANGTFYYSSLTQDFLVGIFTSTDNGVSWLPPVPAFGGDKQWITVDRTNGIGSGNIYQSWSTAAGCCGNRIFTRSTDAGQSFLTPVTIPNTPVWGTLDVAPDGTLYISGAAFQGAIYVSRSTNAQDPQATPTFQTVTVDLGGNLRFSTGPNPAGLLGQVWLAVDPSSGPTAGWIYLLASVDPPGIDPLDVHFARSTDGGVSWSPWRRVNDDPEGTNYWQWFATMSTAPNGRIDAVWNDTRDTGIVNLSALYYSFSTDGGATWSANERISEFWDSFVGWPQQNKIGDYYHMVSDDVGASLAWAATFNNEQDVYYTRIGDYDCNVNGVPDSLDIAHGTSPDTNMNGIPDECEETVAPVAVAEGGAPESGSTLHLYPGTPNPFNPETTIRFEAATGGERARLAVYDAEGRLVRTLFDGMAGPGPETVTWDGRDDAGRRLASGVYYCRLASGGSSATRAMVLLE